ncbi:MAG: YceI family protein [Chitinophagales bacterium]
MKRLSERILLILLVLISIGGYIMSCTHENIVPPPPATGTPDIKRGNGVFLPGTLKVGDTSQWKFDKAHSSVLWSANYLGAPGLLTGRFNQFGASSISDAQKTQYPGTGQPLKDTSWAFYENDPTKTYINGYVQMNASNTGEPGRDGGCYLGYVGAPKLIPSTQNLIDSNIALIKTTKVEFDPNSAGYIVTMTMTWKGLLSSSHDTTINGTLSYNKRSTVGAGTASAYDVFGLQLNFSFNCRSFGMTTAEVGDVIDIECNINFNNK